MGKPEGERDGAHAVHAVVRACARKAREKRVDHSLVSLGPTLSPTLSPKLTPSPLP